MGVRPHVVIVGAGFGGLAAARDLERAPVEVTLIDRNNFTTFRQRNLRILMGEVTGVDWERRELLVADERAVPFDHLVLAVGAVATWFGVSGAAEYAVPLYTLEDAVEVRNHVVSRFEAADADPSLVDQGELNFVVVGGGPTGVEMAGALAELFAVVFKRDYPALGVARARVVLVETRDRLLEPFHGSSQRAALDALRARQVEVRLEETVDEVTPDHVRFASGEVLSARTVIWAAGVRAHPVARAMGLPTTNAGRVQVAADLSVPGREGVWAVGDVAAPHAKRDRGVLPQLAPVAMQSGAHVARQIGRLCDGKPTQPFRFRDKGTMATIGRRAAIAELPGRIRLHGTLAWLAWLGLHILYLAGVRNRASVLLNWAWGYVTWDRGPRIILRPDSRPSPVMATERARTALDSSRS
jgi:NADH dehydrogenase